MRQVERETVFVILQGPSVSRLENYIDHAKYDKIATVNAFWAYNNIMRNKAFDYLFMTCTLKPHIRVLRRYLSQQGKTTLVTSERHYAAVEDELEPFKDRVLTTKAAGGRSAFEEGEPMNSVTALIISLIQEGYRKFRVFGCDGADNTYYDKNYNPGMSYIKRDAEVLNERFWDEIVYLGVGKIDIININQQSNVNCWQKMSYEQYFKDYNGE